MELEPGEAELELELVLGIDSNSGFRISRISSLNKCGLKGFKWSSLNAHVSPISGIVKTPLSLSGVIRIGVPMTPKRKVEIFENCYGFDKYINSVRLADGHTRIAGQ